MTAQKSATILVIEDDRAVRESTVELLRSDGHDVVEASDGIEGLERLREGTFDVVLLDLHLPRLDGIGVIDALEDPPPLILVSAFEYFDEQVMRDRLGPKVVAFLRKPVRPQRLLVVVADVASGRVPQG